MTREQFRKAQRLLDRVAHADDRIPTLQYLVNGPLHLSCATKLRCANDLKKTLRIRAAAMKAFAGLHC